MVKQTGKKKGKRRKQLCSPHDFNLSGRFYEASSNNMTQGKGQCERFRSVCLSVCQTVSQQSLGEE